MKRHVQKPGVRKWSGDDLLELQGEPLAVLDQFFGRYGDMVIKGCEIDQEAGTVSAGLVAISGKDVEGKDTYKVCPFRGATGVRVFPAFLALKFTEFTRDYDDAVVRPIAYQYEAELLAVKPTDRPCLELSANGRVQFLDVIQDTLHRFVSDDDRKKWDAKATAGHTHAIATTEKAGFMSTSDRKKVDKLGVIEDYPQGETVAGKIEYMDSKIYIPTLENEPTENTLTYRYNNKEYNFSIGQQCRVFDTKGEDYVFYQLYNITEENKADWRITGSGGVSSFSETVKITLSSNQESNDNALIGKKVTLKYSGQQTEFIWNGVTLEYKVSSAVEYEVIPEALTNYSSPQSRTYVAVGGNERQINLVYSCEKVTVQVSTNDNTDCSNRTVTIRKTSNSEVIGTGRGANVIIKVPFGISYKVSVDEFTGYSTPAEQSFIANIAQRNIDFVYSTETVTVNVSASDGANCSERTVRIVNNANSTLIGTGKGTKVVIKVPFGVNYKISVDEIAGYLLPSEQSFIANSITRIVSFVYEKIPEASIVFDKAISDPANISGDINSGVIASYRNSVVVFVRKQPKVK